MSMKTLQMSNVVLHPDMEKFRPDFKGVFHMIDPVISRLAMLNPLWTFVVTARGGNSSELQAFEFQVKSDGEVLGEIGTSYMGQRGRVICVSNDRIGKNRQRSNSYRTSDADKAIVMAKKMFGKMNPNERMSKAKDAAEVVVTRASWNKDRELGNQRTILKQELMTWAESQGFALFMEYIKTEAHPSTANKINGAIERVEVLKTEMKTIEQVQKEFASGTTALVVKDSGKYLVRIGDKVDLYDDNTLPVDMRMKLGMLKLVENEQYITEMGCKVTDEIFVLLVS
jgi:hypothetical protein